MRRFLRFVAQDALPELEPDELSAASNDSISSPFYQPQQENDSPSIRHSVHATPTNPSSDDSEPHLTQSEPISDPSEDNHPSSPELIPLPIPDSELQPQEPTQYGTFLSTPTRIEDASLRNSPLKLEAITEEDGVPVNVNDTYDEPASQALTSDSSQRRDTVDILSPEAGATNLVVDNPTRSSILSPSEFQLRSLVEVLSQFALRADRHSASSVSVSPTAIVDALRELAELMVWADQHYHPLWDVFMECSVMSLIVRCLHASLTPVPTPPPAFPVQTDDVVAAESKAQNGESDQVVFSEEPLKQANLIKSPEPHLPNGHVHFSDDNRGLAHDSARLLSSNADAPNPPLQSVDYTPEVAAAINNFSQQDLVVAIPEASVSAPAGPISRQTNPSHYDTFMMSQSVPPANYSIGAIGEEATQVDSSLTVTGKVQSQILQTLSIIVQSVSRQHSLLCLFSSNHINEVLSFSFSFDGEEMLGLLMSAIKTIAIKLDTDLLQLFYDPNSQSFPLYDVVVQYYNHHEAMVRIAVRNVTLTLCALTDANVLQYVANDNTDYLYNSVSLMKRLCGSAARAFELLMDDGKEVPRTRRRTGIFRRNVRISDLEDRLEEIENLCAYFGDIASLSEKYLRPVVVRMMGEEVFAPIFRPLSSYACPEAVRLMKRRWWSLSNNDDPSDDLGPALPLFDAAARTLLLAFLLTCSKSSIVGTALIREIAKPVARFESRHVFHALKAMCADVSGTERMTYVSLIAVEAALTCDGMSVKLVQRLNLNFEHDTPSLVSQQQATTEAEELLENRLASIDSELGASRSQDEDYTGMVMTLQDFEVPTTPSLSMSSIPTTPTACASSFNANAQASSEFTGVQSSVSVDDVGSTFDGQDDGRILMSLQTGIASIREVLSSIVLVVRKREVRTNRVLRTICGILQNAGETTGDWSIVADVAKSILDDLAAGLKNFLNNRTTTIVAIEAAFDSFTEIIEASPSLIDEADDRKPEDDDFKLSAISTPRMAAACPPGAGKWRRSGSDGIVAPIETEDAQTLVTMMRCYELALSKSDSRAGIISLTEVVKATMEECRTEDSYLEKRDTLLNVAISIISHGELADST